MFFMNNSVISEGHAAMVTRQRRGASELVKAVVSQQHRKKEQDRVNRLSHKSQSTFLHVYQILSQLW